MEYVEGVPLTNAAHPLALRQKTELLHKVVLAVDFLHRHNLVHRDLKPGNILVGPDLEPKLLDLGLALPLEDRRLTTSGEVMGTPSYATRGRPAFQPLNPAHAAGTAVPATSATAGARCRPAVNGNSGWCKRQPIFSFHPIFSSAAFAG
jgi:serine/threonine protein kinase